MLKWLANLLPRCQINFGGKDYLFSARTEDLEVLDESDSSKNEDKNAWLRELATHKQEYFPCLSAVDVACLSNCRERFQSMVVWDDPVELPGELTETFTAANINLSALRRRRLRLADPKGDERDQYRCNMFCF